VIYLCSEHLLEPITKHIQDSAPWRGLLLSEPSSLPTLLSKNSVMRLVAEAGIPIPKTLFPGTEEELVALGPTLEFPLLVKGEGGESSRTIRIIRSRSELLASYRAVLDQEKTHDTKPCLQEFITGPTYSVGGLFQDGRAIRICAGRMALMEPYKAGLMVKGVTERPPNLIANALRVFEALRYTGFGDADFVLDPRDGEFKFLEVNPEVWANIVLAEHAGVDFHGPYRALAQGEFVPADLTFREGVSFYRVTKRLLSTCRRPWLGMSFVRDFLDASVYSDWDWTDLQPDIHLLINSVRRRSRVLSRDVTGKTLSSHP
jgi:predicted ATP-grasp superfamily ATP-dependent carboligase